MPRPRAERPTFSLTLRQGRYYVQWWENGAARRVSCRTSNTAAARRVLAEIEAGYNTPAIPESPTIGDILDAYRKDRMRRSVGPAFSRIIDTVQTVLADLPADLLTKERVRHYISTRRSGGLRGAVYGGRDVRPLSDATLRSELKLLTAGLHWAKAEQWIAAVPVFDMPAETPPRQRWLTREEARRLIDAAVSPHMRLFIVLGLYTGARAGAILELLWERVDMARGIIDFGTAPSANKRRAVIPMHAKVREGLDQARPVCRTPFVVEYRGKPVTLIGRGFKATARRADLAGVTPHTLRHTAATWMAQKGVPLDRVAAYLGNSPAVVAKHYVHHTPDYMHDALQALDD